MSESDDPFAAAARELQQRRATHEEVRSSKRHVDADLHLRRLIQDFAVALRASWVAFTRYPNSDLWLLQRSTDDLLESVIAVPTLTSNGMVNVARRELRYLLEATVKYVYVDQQLDGDAPLEERVRYLGDPSKVPRSSITTIDDTKIWMLDEPEQLRHAVKQSFGALSGDVHPSRTAVKERLARAERGEFVGFEGPRVLEAFNGLMSQTLDVVLALIFQGIGPSFTGDLFIQIFDDLPDWKFHRTRFVAQISRHFDYKVERQDRCPSPAESPID